MHPKALLALAFFAVSACAAVAGPLTDKSKAPDWGRATLEEKDAWLAGFTFEQADVDRARVAECLDTHANKPLFETNDLSGVTRMCGTIAAMPQ